MKSSTELPRAVVSFENEDIESIACRLAWANGFRCGNDLFGVREARKLVSLKTMPLEGIRKLSELSGIPEKKLTRFWTSTGVIIPYGETTVKRRQINVKVCRFCPWCLLEDRQHTALRRGGNQYIRGAWNWSSITACHIHGTPLVTSKQKPGTLPDFSRLLREGPFSEPTEPNEADVYFNLRLQQPAGDGFLDRFPAYVVSEFCSILGEFQRTLASREVERIGIFETPETRYAGYAIAKHGKDAILDFLSCYVRDLPSIYSNASIYYRAARLWWNTNKHNPDYRPLMMLLQDHAEENIPLDRGDTFFWPVLTRKIHTLASAAEAYGITEDRVEQLLAGTYRGTLPRFLKKEIIHRPLIDARNWLKSTEVAEMLGCRQPVAAEIMKSDLLTSVRDVPEDADSRRVVHRSEVAQLLDVIRSALSPKKGKASWRPVSLMKRHGGAVGVLRLVRDGHLTRLYSSTDAVRVDSLHVDIAEVKSLPRDFLDPRSEDVEVDGDLLDIEQARRRMRCTRSLINALIAAGLIDHVLIPNSRQWKGTSRLRVRRASLDRFFIDHVSLDELSLHKCLEPADLLVRLGGRDIHPMIQGDRFVGRYYRRIEIPDNF